MLLSIVTASFNAATSIGFTLGSILYQTIDDFEYIVIDGGSVDETINIIRSYEKSFENKGIKFKYISEPDKGIYDAWNKGIELASGDWIAFIGADDIYKKNSLELYKKEINKEDSHHYDLIYSNVKVVDKDKHLKTIKGTWYWKKFRRYMNIAHVGAFHNKKYFDKHGVFDINYKICGDYELLLRAGEDLKCKKIEKTTVVMSYGGISNSRVEKVLMETLTAKTQTAKVNILTSKYDFSTAFIKYYIRKMIYAFYR